MPGKVTLIDFCGTVVPFQTANAFVEYVSTKHPTNHARRVQVLYSLLNNAKILGLVRRLSPSYYIDKRLMLYKLKGLDESVLEEESRNFYEEEVKPNIIQAVRDELTKRKKEGYRLCVLSGGYSIYIKHFAADMGIRDVISSRLKIVKGKCCGVIDGMDCMNENKPRLLLQYFPEESNMNEWYFYTDSATDLPVLKLVGHPVVVSRGKSQAWAQSQRYSEIIY